MNAADPDMGQLIKAALQLEAALMREVDTWPRVVELARSSVRRRRRRRVSLVLAAASAIVLAAATSIIASASSDARHLVAKVAQSAAQVVGIRLGGTGRPPSVTPTPGFRLVAPEYLPAGLDVNSTAYSPGRPANGRGGRTVEIFTAGPAGTTASRATADPARWRDATRLGLPTVDERFSSSKSEAYVEILQRPQAASEPKPTGETVAVGTTDAVVVDRGNETTLTLIRSGVRIQVITNLGRSEAIRIAASLR
jgi:hypothetical protein